MPINPLVAAGVGTLLGGPIGGLIGLGVGYASSKLGPASPASPSPIPEPAPTSGPGSGVAVSVPSGSSPSATQSIAPSQVAPAKPPTTGQTVGGGPDPAPASLLTTPGILFDEAGNLTLMSAAQAAQAVQGVQALMAALFSKTPVKVTTSSGTAAQQIRSQGEEFWTTGAMKKDPDSGRFISAGTKVNSAGFEYQLPSGVAVRRHADGTAEYLGWTFEGKAALDSKIAGAQIARWVPISLFPGALYLANRNQSTGAEAFAVGVAQTVIKEGIKAGLAGSLGIFGDDGDLCLTFDDFNIDRARVSRAPGFRARR